MYFRYSEGLRIFNSYSWKDRDIVRDSVKYLIQEKEMCMFLDMFEIDNNLVISLRKEIDENEPIILSMSGKVNIYSMILNQMYYANKNNSEEIGIYNRNHLSLCIKDAIEDSGMFLLWLSKNSINSKWVIMEIQHAIQESIPIFIVYLDDFYKNKIIYDYFITYSEYQNNPEKLIKKCYKIWEDLGSSFKKEIDEDILQKNEGLIKTELQKRINSTTNGSMVFINSRINNLLTERYELCKIFGVSPDRDKYQIDNNYISANTALIGNLIISRENAGKRAKKWPHYCGKCAGMINYSEVYPELKSYNAGCRCP